MIADDANPERRALWAVLHWLEQWQGTDLYANVADGGVLAADVIHQEAKGQIDRIKRVLAAPILAEAFGEPSGPAEGGLALLGRHPV